MNAYKFKVNDMACSMCEEHINSAVRSLDGIKKVKSNYKQKEMTVYCDGTLNTEAVIKKLKSIGYDADYKGENIESEKNGGFFGLFTKK